MSFEEFLEGKEASVALAEEHRKAVLLQLQHCRPFMDLELEAAQLVEMTLEQEMLATRSAPDASCSNATATYDLSLANLEAAGNLLRDDASTSLWLTACPRYCSRECQKEHWKEVHKEACANLAL
eukprot:jgi/Mesvir1/13894/Mv16022-RA.1